MLHHLGDRTAAVEMGHDGQAGESTVQPPSRGRAPTRGGKPGFLGRVEAVRGLAALCVALTHTVGFLLLADHRGLDLLDQASARDGIVKVIDGLFNGETAVTLFFVISGVVIGRSLDGRRTDFVSFLVRRVFRLYPAHIVATVGIIGLAWMFLMGREPIDFTAYPGMPAAEAVWLNGESYNPLKLRSVIGTMTMAGWSLNLVVWSLYSEMCAAPLLPLFHRLARKGSGRVDLAVMAGLIGLSLLNWNHLWSRYLFVFYLGMLVETRGVFLADALARLVRGRRLALWLCYLLMVLPNTFAAGRSPLVILLEALGAFGVVSLIVRSEGRPAFASLDHPLLRWNGRLSYSFYLWHYFILTVAVRTLYATMSPEMMRAFELPIFVAVLLGTVAIAIALAQLSYRYVELPFTAFGRALADRLRRTARKPRSAPVHSAAPSRPFDRDDAQTA
jgi:peptidoglycan/LPS O-acetylase OafA/YrhL